MKVKVKSTVEVEVSTLYCQIGVRYWEDATVDGIEDEAGDLMPCRNGRYWEPIIDLSTGQITNWNKGVTADVHFKVCDDGLYAVKDSQGNTVLTKDGYVPDIMCPGGQGFGDYVIMHIDENGFIQNWKANLSDFDTDEDDD